MELIMYEDQSKIIRYLIAAIVAYYILQIIMPFLIWGLLGLVAWQIYLAYHRGR